MHDKLSYVRIETRQVVIEKTEVSAELQIFEESDKERIKTLYKNWISLSKLCLEMEGRRINIPEVLSEGVFCIELNCARFLNCSGGVSSSFDCLDLENNERIQVKATSVKEDLTSFGPRSKWDKIFLMHFFPTGEYDGSFCVYQIDNDFIYNHKVNKNETFKDQQLAGKRPRFSIMKDIIIPKKIKPIKAGNILDY